MVDEAGRRQDSAYAYLRPVMGPGGVPSLLFQMGDRLPMNSIARTMPAVLEQAMVYKVGGSVHGLCEVLLSQASIALHP
jgi:hypothetical protein